MARIRSVKPELRRDLDVGSWPIPARYAWVLLWGYLDDAGRGRDDLRLLVADLFPLDRDVTEKKLDGWLKAMTQPRSAGKLPALCRYEVDGERFLHAVKWDRHQRINRPSPSMLPPCPTHYNGASDSLNGSLSGHELRHASVTESDSEDSLRARKEQGEGSREKGAGKASATAEPRETDPDDGPEPPASPTARPDHERPDIELVCRHLADRVEANGSKRPTVTAKWRTSARLMLDTDGRTVDQIVACIDWAQGHEFWRSNVMSMPKLREKYDQMRLQAGARNGNGNGQHANGHHPKPSTTDERVGAGLALAAKYAAAEGQPMPTLAIGGTP